MTRHERAVCLVPHGDSIFIGPAMRDIGISRAYACALTGTLDELMHQPRVSSEVVHRVQWLKWALRGYEPGCEPLELDSRPRSRMPPPSSPNERIASACERRTPDTQPASPLSPEYHIVPQKGSQQRHCDGARLIFTHAWGSMLLVSVIARGDRNRYGNGLKLTGFAACRRDAAGLVRG